MTDPKQKPRPVWRIVLVLSLAANLLVVGVVAGALLRPGGPLRGMDHPPRGGLIFFREMPREARREIRAAAQDGYAHRTSGRAAHMNEVLEVLRAPSFDEEALRDLMARHAETMQVEQMEIMELWVGHVAGMSDTERREYAERVEQASRGRHGRRRHFEE